MRAEHEEELWISNSLQVVDFTFQPTSSLSKQDRIEDDNRTLKVYTPGCITGKYLHFVDIYNGHTISFKPQLDAEYDDVCKKSHIPIKHESHPPIRDLEFERFGSFDIALFIICQAGIYLSTAALNKNNRIVQIDSDNKVLVHSNHAFWGIQLLRIDDQTGIAVYSHNETTTHNRGHHLQTFHLTDTGEIQLSICQFVGKGLVYRIFPLILNGHLHYFSEYGTLIDYDYSNGTFQFEDKLIPRIKGKDQGVWYEKRFYFLYLLELEQRADNKDGQFGVFNMETRRFSILHLPDSIPTNWMEKIYKILSFCPFIFVDERGILSILPMNMKEREKCKHVEKVTEYSPCPTSLFRIPLRLPETLSNLTYFSFLKKSGRFQQEFKSIIQSLYPGHLEIIKVSQHE